MENLLEIFQKGLFFLQKCSLLISHHIEANFLHRYIYSSYPWHFASLWAAHCSTCYCPSHRNLNALVGGLQKSAHTGKKLKSPNYVTLHFHLMWRQSCKKLLWRRFKWVNKNEDCKEHRWKSPKYSRRYWEWESSGGLFYLANYICQNCQMYLSKL